MTIRSRKPAHPTFISLFLTLVICLCSVSISGQENKPEGGEKPTAGQSESQNQKPAQPSKPDAEALIRMSHAAQQDLAKEFVSVHVSVLAPQNVADIYGRRIAHRYVAFQITIRNESRDYQFLVQDIDLNMAQIAGDPGSTMNAPRLKNNKGETTYTYRPTSTDLSLIRGVSEKGQNYDPRNFVLRILRGAGTVAAGLIGVTTFGLSYAPSVAVFNGPLITAYTDVFRDSTINQLIRLSDSAYQTNVLVGRQNAKVLVAFVDQAMFMDKDHRSKFYKDPMTLVPEIDFRKAIPSLYGMLITEVLDQPTTLLNVFIDDDQKKHLLDTPVAAPAFIIGRNLLGAKVSMASPVDGIDVRQDTDAEANRLDFVITSPKPITTPKSIVLLVRKSTDVSKIAFEINPQIAMPTLDAIADSVQPGDSVALTLKGDHFIKGVTKVTIDPVTGITGVDTAAVQDDLKSIKLTLKITDAGVGVHHVTVSNGEGLVNKTDLTVKPKTTQP